MLLNLPNAITLGRLCAVPVAVWLLLIGRPDVCLWVFVAAGLSDMLDGYIANMATLPDERVRADWIRLRRFYFDHVDDPRRRRAFTARLRARAD